MHGRWRRCSGGDDDTIEAVAALGDDRVGCDTTTSAEQASAEHAATAYVRLAQRRAQC